MHHRIPFFSQALRLSVRRFQMPLEGLRFVMVEFGIIYATDPLLQNIELRLFASFDSQSIFLTINPCRPVDHAELLAPIFQNQGSSPHALFLKRSQ